ERQPGLGHALVPAKRATGEIGGLEAGQRRHLRHDRIERTGRDDEVRALDEAAEVFHEVSFILLCTRATGTVYLPVQRSHELWAVLRTEYAAGRIRWPSSR